MTNTINDLPEYCLVTSKKGFASAMGAVAGTCAPVVWGIIIFTAGPALPQHSAKSEYFVLSVCGVSQTELTARAPYRVVYFFFACT